MVTYSKYRTLLPCSIRVTVILLLTIVSLMLNAGSKYTNTVKAAVLSSNIESVSVSIVDENASAIRYIVSEDGKVTFSLKISSSMKEEIPVLYTFFLDGKQTQAYWNGEKLTTFIKLIHPGESMRIEVGLDNISKGIHNLYLGHVKHPERIYWPDTDDLSDTAFMISPIATVLYDDAAHKTKEDFPHLHAKNRCLA